MEKIGYNYRDKLSCGYNKLTDEIRSKSWENKSFKMLEYFNFNLINVFLIINKDSRVHSYGK